MHTFIFALPAGYEHAKKENQKEIDSMMVALCFTFVVKDDYNQSRPLCAPIVTSCIVNSKSKSISLYPSMLHVRLMNSVVRVLV